MLFLEYKYIWIFIGKVVAFEYIRIFVRNIMWHPNTFGYSFVSIYDIRSSLDTMPNCGYFVVSSLIKQVCKVGIKQHNHNVGQNISLISETAIKCVRNVAATQSN